MSTSLYLAMLSRKRSGSAFEIERALLKLPDGKAFAAIFKAGWRRGLTAGMK